MRLTAEEVAAIKVSAREAFGDDAIVRLFGSRTDDRGRGGDIDLHIEVNPGGQDLERAADFRWFLFGRIEEQKVDLVFHVRGRPLRAIDHIAMAEGVTL